MSATEPAVECYSGHTYAQEPRALVWQGQRHAVARVEHRWRTPTGPAFRVHSDTGQSFDLHYHDGAGTWKIDPLQDKEVPE